VLVLFYQKNFLAQFFQTYYHCKNQFYLSTTNTSIDRLLFQQISEGSEAAFAEIFHRYTPRLRPFIYGILKLSAVTDEVLQEVFLKVWLNRDVLVNVNEPSAWLYRIASNLSLNQLRKQANEYKKLKEIITAEGHESDNLLAKLSAKELQQMIYEAVTKLPEKRKEIYLMSREAGLSHKEIAEKLDISVITVKNQVTSALKIIQEHITKTSGVYIPLVLLCIKINSYGA
jgi:RNA polymerase sigma-70 factor (family 1)